MSSSDIDRYGWPMARWAPGARGRLQAAAFELFTEKGYAETTVADIAARAGVTERTFYRYFADRREVFFDGSRDFQDFLVHALDAAPAGTRPLDAVTGALFQAAREIFPDRAVMARQRQRLIDAHPELQERELAKMSRLATALAAALRSRGVEEPTASVAAETGIALFRVAFAHWVDERNATDLEDLISAALQQLSVIASSQ
jgi:AcrR family transcriptional regulator